MKKPVMGIVNIRVPDEVRAVLQKQADEQGLTTSQFVRSLLIRTARAVQAEEAAQK